MKKIISITTSVIITATLFSACQQTQPLTPEQPTTISIATPQPSETINSPLNISGEATLWFFEAEFPITLQDENGNTLGITQANPTTDWMTEDPVPFTATINFTKPATGTNGKIIFEKNNPSGISELDETFELPVRF